MNARAAFAVTVTAILLIGVPEVRGGVQSPEQQFELRVLTDVGVNQIQQLARQAERGDVRSQRRLGMMYLTGDDPFEPDRSFVVAIDPEEAAKWFRMAAEQGDLISQLRLGLQYHDGYGVPQDYAEAAKWLLGPAEAGDVDAQTFLGSVYTRTDDTWTLDYQEAATWFQLAVDQGSTLASVFLAGIYHNGLGVDLDFDKAMELYRGGSENATAQFNIGIMYRRGEGVDVDLEEAAEWIERAADQGHTMAQYELGTMYHEGSGVRQDNVRAHMWVDLAAESSSGVELQSRIEMRNAIAAEMSADEIQEANRLRREWLPGSQQ